MLEPGAEDLAAVHGAVRAKAPVGWVRVLDRLGAEGVEAFAEGQALRHDGARHWVRIFDLSRREPCDREVTIGQITLAGAEIASGLEPGDQVLLPVR